MKVIFKNSSIKFQIGAVVENVTFTEGSGYVQPGGSRNSSTNGHNSGLIPLEGVTKILAHVTMQSNGCVIAFYNSDSISTSTFLSAVSILGKGVPVQDYIVDNLADARTAGATHFVISYYWAGGLKQDCYAKYWKER